MELRNIPGGIVISIAIGVADGLIVWGIATLFDVSIMVPDSRGSETLTDLALWNIVLLVGIASVAAGILLWFLERISPERALAIFQIVAVVVLVVSLALPFTTDQALAAQLALVAMHILVGSAIIGTMTWVATKPAVAPEAAEGGAEQ